MGNCLCLLLELDQESGDLVAVACSDPADEVLLGLRVRFEDERDNREALVQRRSIVVEDLVWGAGTDHVYREKLSIRSALFVPIHSEGNLMGSLLLHSSGRRENYSPRDVARAEMVAEQAASAISNARLYRDLERSELRATSLLRRNTRLRERNRLEIANVIHDDVVQTIVAALYELENLREEVSGEALADVDRAVRLLRQSIADARRMISELRPPVVDGLGLTGALRALVERTSADSGLRIEASLEDIVGMTPGVATALYMIGREALLNARRHAGARLLRVSLTQTQVDEASLWTARMRVSDDGCGFDTERSGDDHFGLTMMDEQAALAGGSLTVVSSPGTGTLVEVAVPLVQPEGSRESL
jgi:signal transduction histidine kinase